MEHYKCLECGAIGTHNFNSWTESYCEENYWAEYNESLNCENCLNSEWISGRKDGLETYLNEGWSKFSICESQAETTSSHSSESDTDTDIIKKGNEGESEFNNWLKDNNISYLYIDQSTSTFSTLFKNDVKRPDFLMLIESIGMIAIDVKNYTQYENTYSLNMKSEFLRSLAFERLFRIPLWYVYKSQKDGKTKWLWISALKALEVGKISKNTKTKERFLRIDVKYFEEIGSNKDIGKLYTHRLPTMKKLSTL